MYRFLIVLSFLLLSLNSNSQVNLYFANDPVWKMTSGQWINGCSSISVYNYYLNGDTIINSTTFPDTILNTKTYKKVYSQGIGFLVWNGSGSPPPNCPPDTITVINSVPDYFIRSDQKIWYIIFPNDSIEYLLYDFNLNIGDTIPQTIINLQNNIYVTNIDSFFTPNGYYKIFNLSSGFDLIEGIGSTFGLIEPMSIFIESSSELLCFSINNTSYYPSSGLNCEVITNIKEVESDFIISVFPNPFTDHLIINKKIKDKLRFKIYNSEGKLVEEQFIDSEKRQIKLKTDVNPGFYFYSVTDEKGKTKNGKLVKN